MTRRFITSKTSRLYEQTTGQKQHMVMIFGDELDVDLSGNAINGRRAASFRGRSGFVDVDHIGEEAPLEMYFIDVGQGDATFIVTPDRKTILIDGGLNRQALGFLIWKYRLDTPANSVDVDLLVLSHADGDHLKGLIPIIEHDQIHVKHVIHSGIATYKSGVFATSLGDRDSSGNFLTTFHESLSDLDAGDLSDDFAAWQATLLAEKLDYRAVDSEADITYLGDLFPELSLEILGPRFDYDHQGYAWFGDPAHTINGHSVVLKLTYRGVSSLFPGDINIEGSKQLLADPVLRASLSAHILKCPHHGSHEFHPPFLEAVRPQISVISSGDGPDHGHPRAVFMGGIGRVSRAKEPLVFSTEIAATFTDTGETLDPAEIDMTLNDVDFAAADANEVARRLFKKRLPGIINVRTDGVHLYAARRVAQGYWWESYGPHDPSP